MNEIFLPNQNPSLYRKITSIFNLNLNDPSEKHDLVRINPVPDKIFWK